MATTDNTQSVSLSDTVTKTNADGSTTTETKTAWMKEQGFSPVAIKIANSKMYAWMSAHTDLNSAL